MEHCLPDTSWRQILRQKRRSFQAPPETIKTHTKTSLIQKLRDKYFMNRGIGYE